MSIPLAIEGAKVRVQLGQLGASEGNHTHRSHAHLTIKQHTEQCARAGWIVAATAAAARLSTRFRKPEPLHAPAG